MTANNSRKKWDAAIYLRQKYREKKLTDDQVERLKAIGFDFKGQSFDPAKESLAALYPDLAEQWDSDRNGNITPSDVKPQSFNQRPWWRCPDCKRPYKLAIRARVNDEAGCPYCGGGGTHKARIATPVIRLDTLETYSSTKKAARAVGYDINAPLRQTREDRKGVRWCYLIDYEMGRIPEISQGNRFEAIYCLETGQRFETQTEAEKYVGVASGCICRVLNKDKTSKGYHWVTESRYSDELSKAARKEAEKNAYKVICLETGERYRTIAEAGDALAIKTTNIDSAVRSNTHYTSGLHFMKCSEYDALTEDEVDDILKKGNRTIAVVCVETGTKYDSIKKAAQTFGTHKYASARSRISECCRNPHRTYEGKHWCYPEDLAERVSNANKYVSTAKFPVRCIETGKAYESIAAAGRETGISSNCIRLVVRGLRNKAGGLTWEYACKLPTETRRSGGAQNSSKPVRCIETGVVYPSTSAAGRAMGLKNYQAIRRAIERSGTSCGYHWEYCGDA